METRFLGCQTNSWKVINKVDIFEADILLCGKIVTYKILKDNSHVAAHVNRIEITNIDTILQYLSFRGIIKTR